MTTTLASKSSAFHRWKYHVFLSFRGEDNRFQFTDHLYQALRSKGVEVFRDKDGLRTGEHIPQALLQAIEESRIAIVVFSENYASSPWCLDELVKIVECRNEKGQEVLPVFYNVDPSEVRNQKGSYGEALADHAIRFHDDFQKVERWRSALHQAGNLSGELYGSGGYESQFIRKIIENISTILHHPLLYIAENPVGLDSRKLEVVSLLELEGQDSGLCMGGIYGIGGSGKTTIAKALYNSIATQFECTCFLADIRESSTREGLVGLQERILMDMLRDHLKLSNVHQGISIMRDRLSNRKILLILDDVDSLRHLKALAGESSWFGPGSKVIITTRDRHLLVAHGVQRMYEVKEFSNDEALELLCWNAFKSSQPLAGYTQLAARALDYAKGLPLALEIIGSHLNGEGEDVWKCALTNYERNMTKDIYNVLRISYDQLEYNEREMFLDIAFFFKGESLDYVEKILEPCGFHPKSGMKVLEHRSFLKIRSGKIWMHDLIQGLGREIVRRESEREPGKRSRLACQDDIRTVLTRDTGTSKIQGIVLNMPQLSEVQWSGKALKKMVNLRILIIRNAIFSRIPQWLPDSLRVLDWMDYPSSSLPASFDGSGLLFLNLSKIHPVQIEDIPTSSSLKRKDLQALIMRQVHPVQFTKYQNLVYLIINYCKLLKEVPDVSALPELVELRLDFCFNLVKIHDSVGCLEKLQLFSAVSCLQLKNFPAGNGLKSLKMLNLTGCRSIKNFSNVSRSEYRERVPLSDTAIDLESIGIPCAEHAFVVLPGAGTSCCIRIPAKEESFSFWIKRVFPILSVSFALSTDEYLTVELSISVGRFKAILRKEFFIDKSCYVLTFNLLNALTPEDYLAVESEIQKGWVQVELFCVVTNARSRKGSRDETQVGISIIKQCGLYLLPRESIMDISSSDPYLRGFGASHSKVDGVKQFWEHQRTVLGCKHTAVKRSRGRLSLNKFKYSFFNRKWISRHLRPNNSWGISEKRSYWRKKILGIYGDDTDERRIYGDDTNDDDDDDDDDEEETTETKHKFGLRLEFKSVALKEGQEGDLPI